MSSGLENRVARLEEQYETQEERMNLLALRIADARADLKRAQAQVDQLADEVRAVMEARECESESAGDSTTLSSEGTTLSDDDDLFSGDQALKRPSARATDAKLAPTPTKNAMTASIAKRMQTINLNFLKRTAKYDKDDKEAQIRRLKLCKKIPSFFI